MATHKLRPFVNSGLDEPNMVIKPVYPILYRFMEERYVDDFLNEGKVQISTIPFCRQYENKRRGDAWEACYGYDFVDESGTYSLNAKVADNAFVLCASLTQGAFHEAEKSFCLEIRSMDVLAHEICKKLRDMGYDIYEILAGPCNYAMKQREIDLVGSGETVQNLLMRKDSSGNLIPDEEKVGSVLSRLGEGALYFTKDFMFTREHEFRVLWLGRKAVSADHVVVTIDHPERFGCKVASVNFG